MQRGIVLVRCRRHPVGSRSFCRVMKDLVFDGELFVVGKFEPIRAEQLDAVVAPGIMRGGNHHARMEPMRMRKKGHPRRRDHARALHLRSRAPQSGCKRGRDPWARFAGIAAQQHARIGCGFAQRVPERHSGGVDGGCIQRILARDAANPIRSKKFARSSCRHHHRFQSLVPSP